MLKRWIFFFLFLTACLSIPAGAKRLTHGFHIAKIRLEFPFDPQWEVPSLLSEDEANRILGQRFRYLDRGAQCYAFSSEDGQYVLKLFRFDQREKRRSRRYMEERLLGFFNSCKLAGAIAPEETGLVYLHLNCTSGKLPILNAKDPVGRPVRLPLDSCRFALQKKVKPLSSTLLEERELHRLSERLEEIVVLLEGRIEKGIGNKDPSLWRNFGFLEDRAVEIDFGNYIARPDFSESSCRRAELERYARHLRAWLEKNAPEHLSEFNERISGTRL